MITRKTLSLFLLVALLSNIAQAGVLFVKSSGITLTGADGITLTGADGFLDYQANGITLTGADGNPLTTTDGITLTGADGITLTGADGVTFTGADSLIGIRADGSTFQVASPNGITLTGVDGITLTGADGITLTGADNEILTGVKAVGLQSIDPELAITLNQATDDSNINAVIVFHQYPTTNEIGQLRQIGILGGTLYRVLPMISISATRQQIAAASRLPQVRSIYGNRTLSFNSDSYLNATQTGRVATDRDLQIKNAGLPVSGRGVTVAVLDTGVNAAHNDLAGKVVQNVRLSDTESAPLGFVNPTPVENLI